MAAAVVVASVVVASVLLTDQSHGGWGWYPGGWSDADVEDGDDSTTLPCSS